jgi:type VI secretion system protein ImpG
MDPRLSQYYDNELQHLLEMGKEFAQENPKVARRLGMTGIPVADPYVERLLEGFAFLAARVQLKLDAEFPRFTQTLLEIVYPHYLSPTPSMVVAQFKPDLEDPALVTGSRVVPRGSTMQSITSAEQRTPCEFRTAQDVALWPIELVSASYFTFAPDLPITSLPVAARVKGGVRLRLKAAPGVQLSKLSLGSLTFYLPGADESTVVNKLYELCLGNVVAALVLPIGRSASYDVLDASHVRAVGFDDSEALLPVSVRSFQGYRLLQEYFAFPARYRFFEVKGLAPAVKRASGGEFELVLLFGRGEPTFESIVNASNFALFCTPAVNLFSRRADRIHVSEGVHEFHVVPDRTRPMDFEVYAVTDVIGHAAGGDAEQRFLPLYSASTVDADADHNAYFTTRRELRRPSSTQKRRGPRSSYTGTEVFVSLADPKDAPYAGDLRQLSIQTLCTNRDLLLHVPFGAGATDFSLDIAAPVKSVRVVGGPSRPLAPLAADREDRVVRVDGAIAWRTINHLSLNYLSLVNTTPEQGAGALRDSLELYRPAGHAGDRKQVEGVRTVQVRPVVRRLPGPGPLVFGRGLEITVVVDERAFEGASAFLLGSVLHRFFTRHVSINSFIETILRSDSRGEISRWVPQWGARPTL